MQDVSLSEPSSLKCQTMAGTSLPSIVETSASDTSYTQLTSNGSYTCSQGNSISEYTGSHGNSRNAGSHSNSGSHSSITTDAATTGQDQSSPVPLNTSESGEVDADKDIAELLGMLSPGPPTSIQW